MKLALALVALAAGVGAASADPALTPSDEAAAFAAAGFKREGGQWRGCGDPGTASYTPGAIEHVADLNGDGLPEAILTEGSVFCFGHAEQGFSLVSKQAKGGWRLIAQDSGIVRVLPEKGVGGWPDLELGGPGFCFPVERWNGREYQLVRHQYQGRRCRP
jgi:hypothetical protein